MEQLGTLIRCIAESLHSIGSVSVVGQQVDLSNASTDTITPNYLYL